jgi:hypothetical protein
MKTKKIAIYFIWFVMLITIRVNATQLNGIYTINPSATATTTNFQNFSSALMYLSGSGARTDGGPSNSSPYGVSGPVTFLVAAATYTGQVNITTSITGTSPVNTITFDGGNGNASTRIITYAGINTSCPTVNITNNPYITLRNLTINNTGTTYGFGILITGTSNCSKINNCNINLVTNISSSYLNGIVIGGTTTIGYSSASRVDSLQIDSNTINGGQVSIQANCNGAFSCLQTKIRNNQILNFYVIGINMAYQNGLNILNNRIYTSISYTNSQGVYIGNCNNNGINSTIISGNKITNIGSQAMYLLNSNNATGNKGFITNNMLGGGLRSAVDGLLYVASSNNWCIANNSINYDYVSSAIPSSALTIYTSTNNSVINNIISVKQNSNSALPVNITSAFSVDSMDYNIFYRQDTSDHQLILVGSTYNSGNFKGAGGFNQHSQYLNPGFVNDTNLHTTAPCVRGISLPYVTNDIDGNTRNSPPNIGACEVQTATNDMSTTTIVSPVYPIAVGSQNLKVRLTNLGANTIYSFNLTYQLNGNTPVTQSWSGLLNPCDTVSILFAGTQQINIPSGTNTLKIYSSNPNYSTDGNLLNDTITSTFVTAMGGTYVIGTAPSNYTTFGAAITDLNTFGIGSAVKFLVKTGTYNESLTITTPTGASAINNISFSSQANNPDSVIVNANGVYVLNLSGSYFSFNKITFNQLSTTTSGAITFSGTPSFDTIYNCKLIAPNTSNTASRVVYGNGVTMNNIILRKNVIQGGYSNLNIISSSSNYSNNCVIDSNVLQNTNNTTFIEYFTNLKFKNNTVSVNTNNNFFTIEYANTGYEFSGNQINVSAGLSVTMFLSYYCNGTSGNRIKINNNIFTAASTGSINLFAPYYYSGFVDFYNNSMILGSGFFQIGYNSNDVRCYNNSISSNNVNYSFYQNETGNTNIDVKNNVISNSNAGVTVYWNNAPSTTLFDYNNLYTTGSNLVSVNSGATTYASLSVWRAAYYLDKNSLSYRPGFTNPSTNLAPNILDTACWSMNGRGMPATFITTDINGNARSSQILNGATDIGAYEFTPTANPPFAVATPSTPTSSSSQYFTFGSDTIATIVWGASVPSSITTQLFSGTNAPQVGGTSFYQTNAYWNITAPAGTYNYNLKLNYKKNWLQNIPSESNMVIAQKSTGINWGIASSSRSIDTINNIMTANTLTNFSNFAGTDATFPLPVKWMNFTAEKIDKDVNLLWSTASELNNERFEVEKSIDNSKWLTIGVVKGNRTTNFVSSYKFIDVSTPQDMTGELYYRLKQVDFDGKFEYSNIVAVNFDKSLIDKWNIFPNPGTSKIIINGVFQSGNFILYDMQGRELINADYKQFTTGIDVSALIIGFYFYRIVDENGISIKTGKWQKQ